MDSPRIRPELEQLLGDSEACLEEGHHERSLDLLRDFLRGVEADHPGSIASFTDALAGGKE